MKLSLNWLNQCLDKPVTAELAQRLLTDQGFPIESVQDHCQDTVIDAEVTSNRSDCLGHVGMAREIAAGAGLMWVPPAIDLPTSTGGDIRELTSVDNQRPELCPLYTARVIRGVKVGPSPAWLRQRLEAIGLRSVNNVVDVTNFVLMETGQPLHAFDMALLAERRIVVRAAADGELFTAIDGSKHQLRSDMLVIADARAPVAVAGVMGGINSEVGEQTTDILLESARFDPLSIRRTARALKLASDSSYRFERGIDPAAAERASDRAARLILELAGGELAQGIIRAPAAALPPQRVATMRVARCNAILGVELAGQRMIEILDALEFQPRWMDADKAAIACTVPTHRLDVQREIDLIEEVARLHGLEHAPIHDRIHIRTRGVQPGVQAARKLRQVLVGHGYHETVTFSFVAPKLGTPFVDDGFAALMIDDERRKAEPMLRPAIAPSLLICRKANQDVGNANVRLFETASTWMRQNGEIQERKRLGMLADADDPQEALLEVRGTIEELLERLGGPRPVAFEPAQWPNLSAAAAVAIGQAHVGRVGAVDQATLDLFGLQTQVVLAELDLKSLLELYPPVRQVGNLPRFPGIERDLSVVVDEAVTWRQVASAVQAVNPPLMEQVRFLVIYRGKPIPPGQKSLSFRMMFRDPQRTLRHDQVDPQVAAVVDRLKADLQAQLRA